MADPFKPPRQFKSQPSNKSKGILDDFAVRKSVATREGTITKAPTTDNDIVNKLYVDSHALDADIIVVLDGAVATLDGNVLILQ